MNFHISVEMGGAFTILSPERAAGVRSTLAASLESPASRAPGAWPHRAERHGVLTSAFSSALSKARGHFQEALEPKAAAGVPSPGCCAPTGGGSRQPVRCSCSARRPATAGAALPEVDRERAARTDETTDRPADRRRRTAGSAWCPPQRLSFPCDQESRGQATCL